MSLHALSLLKSSRSFLTHGTLRSRFTLRRLADHSSISVHYFSSDNKFTSVVGEPRITSPFDNPRRTSQPLRRVEVEETKFAAYDNKDGETIDVSTTSEKSSVEQPTFEEKISDTTAEISQQIEQKATEVSQTLTKRGLWWKFNERIGTHIDSSLPDVEKKRLRLARNTTIGMIVIFGSMAVGFVWFCFHYGRAPRDALGNKITDEHTGSLFAPFYRISDSFRSWINYVVEPSRDKLLPEPLPPPYHQPKYTLVIEMKNILVAPEWTYKTGHRFAKRPALDYFLDIVGYPNFEVVIYSSESSMTAHPIVDSMDPKHRIMYRLFRDCTKYMNGHHVKDLSRLNRDLSKVIFVDFDPKSFQLNPENVLRVPKWDGNMDDTSLVDLAELLKTIHLSDVEDVRPMLQYYSQFDDPAKEFRRRAIVLAEQEAHAADAASPHSQQSVVKKYSGKLFGFRRHQAT
jgi:import inner membrane translocase subunit TIM50